MIDRIIIENFKSLRRIDLSLGRLNLLIGTNASGKSNFLDALRVLQGIGNDFTISEILDGKPRSATSEVWDGIRGGSAKACFAETDDTGEITLTVNGRLKDEPKQKWEFQITFSPAMGRVIHEHFKLGNGRSIYDSRQIAINSPDAPAIWVRYYHGKMGRPPELMFENARPVLGQIAGEYGYVKEHARITTSVADLLANSQCVDPSPPILKQYSPAHRVQVMGDHGENFAALVRTICEDDLAKDAYLEWLRQLRPDEVDDVGTLSGAVGEPLFVLRESGREFPAPVLSEGTLRFAAITAAFFQPDMPEIMTIEEIENGIHASRLRLLVELLRSQAESRKTQIFATTHSPTALEWLHNSEYRTTFFCKRDESTGESTILPLSDVPHFWEVAKKTPISDLFAEGWLETAL